MEISWDELLPPELSELHEIPLPIHDLSQLSEMDAELGDLAVQMEPAAPVVQVLDGRQVKLPGYVVPLAITDTMEVEEFLLVPYFGACIHVPPPPSNQIGHLRSGGGIKLRDLYQPFWISGTLQVEHMEKDLANAGFGIDASSVEPYVY